jgi:predicted 2-oxoglutarate/Fe(II)-dependent dioxygenase YbiX
MSVKIIKNFITEEEAISIMDSQNKFLRLDAKTGYSKSVEPTKELEDVVELIKNRIAVDYGIAEPRCQYSLIVMPEGTHNGLHADTLDYSFDAGWDDLDNISALLYLSSSGIDFAGGSLVFPQHELRYDPECGSLVIFPGDMKHMHGVEKVLSGKRATLVLFF